MTDKLDERPESVQKCPFCGEELSYAQEIDGGFEILTCDCPYGIWFFGNDKMWNFLDDLIAQADKAERLEKENEAMREEFEVWHGNYKCEVEEKERLQKAVDKAIWILEESKKVQRPDFKLGFTYCLFPQPHLDIILDEIKQLIKD